MPHLTLSPLETRILGCLLEKERLTPENYPLSLHSLTAACNQTTNRDPITHFDERTVEQGISALREQKLAILIHSAGARVAKFRHNLPEHYTLEPREVALLCVLLLRGPQTPGELRTRSERMAALPSLEETEAVLHGLSKGEEPLVRLLPPRPGQKERRYVQLLSGEPAEEEAAPLSQAALEPIRQRASRLEELEQELATVRTEQAALGNQLAELRAQFEAFRAQF